MLENIWVVLKIVGPLLVLDDITAPDLLGYQNGTLILGTTHMLELIV